METVGRSSDIRSKSPLRCISLTRQTANSAGSVLVFVRIPGFGNNPVKYTDPDGREDKEPIGFKETWDAFQRGNNRDREKIIGKQANDSLNSGEHKLFDVASGRYGESKAFYATAAADTRLDQGELNLNLDIGGALAKGELGVHTQNNKWAVGVEGSSAVYAGSVFIGIKETSIGVEAGAAMLTYTGAITFTIFGLKGKIGGEFFLGGAKAGISVGLNNSIKLGKGIGLGGFISFKQ